MCGRSVRVLLAFDQHPLVTVPLHAVLLGVPQAPFAIAQEERVVDGTEIVRVIDASLLHELPHSRGVVDVLVEAEVKVEECLVVAAPVDLHLDLEEVT